MAVVLTATGCGDRHRAPAPTTGVPESRSLPGPNGSRAPGACTVLTAGEVRQVTGDRVRARSARDSESMTRCTYSDGVALTVDTGSQAARRFSASRDETVQVQIQGHGDPVIEVHGVGDSAFWQAGPRRLKILDGVRILILDAHGPLPQARRLGRAATA